METLHIRADQEAMREVLATIDRCHRLGNEVELLDGAIIAHEDKLIATALLQIEKGETVPHDALWAELLDEKH